MNRFAPLLALPLLTIMASGADDAAVAADLLKPSLFDSRQIGRNPFERIDAASMSQQSTVVAASADAGADLASLFRVTAIIIDRLAIAVINRKAFAEDESFKVKTGDKELRVIVRRVRDGYVELDCGGTLVTVPVVKQVPKLLLEEGE
jgi:hypothetical protein